MTPIAWALRPLKKYADFSGRAPRAEYWWYVAATTVAGLVVDLLDGQLGGPSFGFYGPLSLTFMLLLFVPDLTVTVRRLHDINRSGWWALLNMSWYAFVIFSGVQAADESSIEQLNILPLIIGCVALLIGGVVMLVFTITRGDEGLNHYGPDPYGENVEKVFA